MSNTCTDVQATLSTYLDGELENADLREFETHVTDCVECQANLESAERAHSALRSHLRNTPKAPDLLRKRLSLALDQEDQARQEVQRRQWLAWSLPAAASALAVAALALFIWTDINSRSEAPVAQSSQVTRDAARQHLQEKPLLVAGDRGSVGRSAASYLNQPVSAPRFSSTKVRLLGWTPAQLGGKQSATFVYEVIDRTGRHEMNVHAVKRSEIDVSTQVKLNLDGAELWTDSAFGFNTVTYAGSETIAYVFSSDMSASALIDLVTNTDIVNMLQRPPR
jgi:anti-sigma factor RsiW